MATSGSGTSPGFASLNPGSDIYDFASVVRRAVAEAVVGLPLRWRIDMEIDDADAALLEHIDTLGDRGSRIGGARHRPDADRTLRLGKLGNAGNRVLHAQAD